MTTTTPYTPSTGLARSVIEFFIANNDEVLDTNDLVNKFSASKASIPTLLKRARECNAIVYNGGLYMLGNIEIARQCIADPADAPAPATQEKPQPAPVVAAPASSPAPSHTDEATGADRNAAAPAAIRAQQQQQKALPALARSVIFPGVGPLAVSFEPLASRIPVSGYKWDPVLDHLATTPKSAIEGGYATVHLPKALAGAAKAGIASWHKRHADLPFPCQFRASVVGPDVLIQCIA